ncbi:MAG TPA: 50S ribosomal protein L7/L12-serine acetyltransferase, partial [Enterobacter sp.]|nr:50S ribosomal protein L7/L12-serine acetyltransferase [Enterobacter sp.]
MTTPTEEIIPVNAHIELRAADERYTSELHNLVIKNRAWLQDYLNWPQYVGTEEDTRQNIQSNQMLHQRGYHKKCLSFQYDALV